MNINNKRLAPINFSKYEKCTQTDSSSIVQKNHFLPTFPSTLIYVSFYLPDYTIQQTLNPI